MITEKNIRLDKWLWASRFFKTRSIAAKAISGGKVHCNNARVKPARCVQIGDELRIQKGVYEFIVIVQAINNKRRPAKEAVLLYEETQESKKIREQLASERRIMRSIEHNLTPDRRPTKKDRRLIRNFIRKDG